MKARTRADSARRWWQAGVPLVLGFLVLASCGSSKKEASTATTAAPAIAFPSTLQTAPPVISNTDPTKAAPRWEQLKVVTGNSSTEIGPITVNAQAIQWRVKWSCDGGSLIINVSPSPPKPGPLVQNNCPGQGEAYSRQTGDVKLSVQGSGPWKATVEQQLDTPLDEPPLPEMATAQVVAKGTFYNVEKTGKGTVTLYKLADGRSALRIEAGFEVVNDPDLVIWLSSLPQPKTSREMSDAPHYELSALKSTKGSQNYILPNDVTVNPIKSVGLFCVPVPAIYVAAALS